MEAALQLVEGGANPAEDHRAAAPALHAAGDPADAVVDVLDGVGGRQRSFELVGEAELLDGEELVEALADGRGGARVFACEGAGERLEAPLRGLRRRRPHGLAEDLADAVFLL